ncbi:hypothetical protein LEP1GSC036_1155 [Leptospira weilii str. 2006001853]|uniref:Uncharacterized protein n=3 Tax=Leptospira weilii TaxID=28184 RepID=A0A828Z111_9LEPT|nr:hypothetical protein LEP1GSC036_1155 [Leptospira weilii str. 2006001853]EMJ64766.1 hypothetical protein LEP1GSC051_3288 [Leptospira sp. P2653]EMM70521.1 hypothetical protein LEP1GSC038_1239 [Leptospira weilii str. 2006001855]EMN44935.1 hypothetical protein LEP1GSC086_0241 [Leptospira weilii str. LNT 1234]EMN89609.1 hypothetical protein LEP1GSC108_2672 [Leptospira weilii str. UI 13098]
MRNSDLVSLTANLEIRGRVANDKFRLFFSLFSEIFLSLWALRFRWKIILKK